MEEAVHKGEGNKSSQKVVHEGRQGKSSNPPNAIIGNESKIRIIRCDVKVPKKAQTTREADDMMEPRAVTLIANTVHYLN